VSTETIAAISLAEPEWRGLAERHRAQVDLWVGDRRSRRSAGRSHPVDDFLFDYYPYSVGRLEAWHPGHGVQLLGDVRDYLAHPDYLRTEHGASTNPARLERHRARLALAIRLLEATAGRDPQLGCFGMHEWAMVYGQQQDEVRHSSSPLRLTPDEIVDVVDEVGLRCTHIDAFRFFTAAAVPLNAHEPTRATQHEWEQPGCLHANMDLYKYAMWFSPFVGSELISDCFALARRARELDMRAAPYDLAALGYEPIRVETPEGRAEYARGQRAIMDSAAAVRDRLCAALARLQEELPDRAQSDSSRSSAFSSA
jgi:hypothetical protein